MPWSTRFVLLLSCGLGGDEKKSQGTCLCGWAFYTQSYPWIHLGCVRLGRLEEFRLNQSQFESDTAKNRQKLKFDALLDKRIGATHPPPQTNG